MLKGIGISQNLCSENFGGGGGKGWIRGEHCSNKMKLIKVSLNLGF